MPLISPPAASHLSGSLSLSLSHVSLCLSARMWQAAVVSACRWSVLTYEAPKQSPPALKEEENGDSNIQVGTARDGEARCGPGSHSPCQLV